MRLLGQALLAVAFWIYAVVVATLAAIVFGVLLFRLGGLIASLQGQQ